MERVGGELVKLCCSPAGSLMKWSDFLVCSFQLLCLQSQDIWPWLFVLLGPPYLQMTDLHTEKNKAKHLVSGLPHPSICCHHSWGFSLVKVQVVLFLFYLVVNHHIHE